MWRQAAGSWREFFCNISSSNCTMKVPTMPTPITEVHHGASRQPSILALARTLVASRNAADADAGHARGRSVCFTFDPADGRILLCCPGGGCPHGIGLLSLPGVGLRDDPRSGPGAAARKGVAD